MPRKPARPVPPDVPSFNSDRLRLLAPLITSRVIELATRRVIQKEKFFVGAKLAVGDSVETVIAALHVAMEIAPFLSWQVEEEALLRGCDADTLRKNKKDHAFRPLG